MQSGSTPPPTNKQQAGSETPTDHSPHAWSRTRACSVFRQGSELVKDPCTPQTPRPFVFRPPSYPHKRPRAAPLSASTGFFISPAARPLFSLKSSQSSVSTQTLRANSEMVRLPIMGTNGDTVSIEAPRVSSPIKELPVAVGRQCGLSQTSRFPSPGIIEDHSFQSDQYDEGVSDVEMEYLKTQQHPAENDSMDLKRAQPTQPQDLGCHQQTDNCNNATDSTDNPKVLENQGELHIEVSSVDHDISALTDVVQKTHALGSNSKSLNGVVLTEQSTSLVGATVLSSSRLDSRHHDLSRHLDSMFTDVTLELQAKDTTISQLKTALENTKLDLSQMQQQNFSLTASEMEARLWSERLQKEGIDLRSNIENLQSRNKSLEQSGLEATEKILQLEIDYHRLDANNKRLKEDVVERVEMLRQSCLEDEKVLSEQSAEVNSFREQLFLLQSGLKEFQDSRGALGETVEITQQKFAEGRQQLEGKCEVLQSELDTVREARSSLQDNLEAARERITVLEESLSASSEKASGLSTELQRRGQEVEALTVENTAMANKIELLSCSMDYEKEILQAQISQLNDLYQQEELGHAKTKSIMAILKSNMEEVEQLYFSLKEESARPESTSSCVSTSDDPQCDLHARFLQLNASFNDQECKARDQARQADAYTSLCASQQTINTTLRIELNASQKQCQDLAFRLEEKSKDIQGMEKAAQSTNQKLSLQTREIGHWKNVLADEQSKLLDQLATSMKDLKKSSDDIASHQAEVQALSNHVLDLENILERKDREMSSLQERSLKLEQELMSSTRAMEELQHKHHHNLVQERQAHKAALESLQGEVQRLADVSRNVSKNKIEESPMGLAQIARSFSQRRHGQDSWINDFGSPHGSLIAGEGVESSAVDLLRKTRVSPTPQGRDNADEEDQTINQKVTVPMNSQRKRKMPDSEDGLEEKGTKKSDLGDLKRNTAISSPVKEAATSQVASAVPKKKALSVIQMQAAGSADVHQSTQEIKEEEEEVPITRLRKPRSKRARASSATAPPPDAVVLEVDLDESDDFLPSVVPKPRTRSATSGRKRSGKAA